MKKNDPNKRVLSPSGDENEPVPAWREQFPIDMPDDEFRSRRDFTKLLGLTSLAFVAGQFFIVFESARRKLRGPLPERDIAGVSEIEVGRAKIFHYPNEGDSCVLVRLGDDEYVAFGQECTHLSCPVIPQPVDGKFYCPCHEGSFDVRTGLPLAGPPRRALPRVTLAFRDGRIIATDKREQNA